MTFRAGKTSQMGAAHTPGVSSTHSHIPAEIEQHVLELYATIRSWTRVTQILKQHGHTPERITELVAHCQDRLHSQQNLHVTSEFHEKPRVLDDIRDHDVVAPQPDKGGKQYRLWKVIVWALLSGAAAITLLLAFWFARSL